MISDTDRLLELGPPCLDLSLAYLASRMEKVALAASTLAEARRQVNTDPSEAQKASGNYAKGHVSWKGLAIAIENPKGSVRSGKAKDGTQWSIRMKHDYGYLKGTVGRDKDHLDVFLGPHLDSELVHIVNQVDPGSRRFDEHKIVFGATSDDAARKVYLANYEPGWRGLGSVRQLSLSDFKTWLAGDTTKRAVDDPTAATKHARDEIKVPVEHERQDDTYSCGPVAFKAVSDEYDRRVPQGALADEAGADPRKGTDPARLVALAEAHGFQAHQVEDMTVEQLKALLEEGFPVIVDIQAWGDPANYDELEEGHYVTAVGYDATNMYFEDPSIETEDGYGRIPIAEFTQRWKDEETDGQQHRHLGIVLFKEDMPEEEEDAGETEKISEELPYRDRVEVYGTNPEGKLLGGYYTRLGGAHGVFGGGVDPGESPEQAGVREFAEEAGYRLHNPQMLPVEPIAQDWKPPYATPQQAERAKQYRGSRTLFMTGQVGEPVPAEERGDDQVSNLRDVRFRAFSTALRHTKAVNPEFAAREAQRRAVLRHLMRAMSKQGEEAICTMCKEPWSTCLGRHGSKPCACGSGKPRNRCDCPGGTPDPEKRASVQIPVLGKTPMKALAADPHPSSELTAVGSALGIDTTKPKKKKKRRKKKAADVEKVAAEMGLPVEEVQAYKDWLDRNGSAYTTRVDAERGKYQPGEVYGSPLGPLQVAKVQSGRGIGAHPFRSELTPAQQRQIRRRLYDLVQFTKSADERRGYGDHTAITPGDPLDFVVQEHNAHRAGLHDDVRFGTPEQGLFSWATRKGLPEPGKKHMLFQQPLHEHNYMNFQGTLRGYGAGTVRTKQKGKITVTSVGPDKIEFTTNGENPQRYVMLRPRGSIKPKQWLVSNLTQGAGGDERAKPGGNPGDVASGPGQVPEGRDPAERAALGNLPPGDQDLGGLAGPGALGSQAGPALPALKRAAEEKRVPTVAVDLDGTLAMQEQPFDPEHVGTPRRGARKWLRKFRAAGARIIIFTVRGDHKLVQSWLDANDMPWDHINENPDQPDDSSGKVIADVYWDDRAVSAEGPLSGSAPEVLERLKSADDRQALTYRDPAFVLAAIQLT